MSGLRTWFGRGLDQDWVDRANGFWSVLLLSVCSVAAFLARYLTQPITCQCPAHFTVSLIRSAHQHCFFQTNMLTSMNFTQLQSDGDFYAGLLEKLADLSRSDHLWIPLILFLQALCFKIPNVIWTLCKSSLSFNYDVTISSLEAAQFKSPEIRSSLMQNAAQIFHRLFQRNNTLLGVLYLVLKLLYLVNLLAQFIFLTLRFGHLLPLKPQPSFLLDVIPHYKPLLPVDIICRFPIIQLQNVQTFTLACQLVISEIYEKMYVFLWFWVFFLAVVTFFNLLLWSGFLFIPSLRERRISAYLEASPKASRASSSMTRFTSNFLGIDGAFLMSMISQNSSEMVAANLSQEMFEVFLQQGRPTPTIQPVIGSSRSSGFETLRMSDRNYTASEPGNNNPRQRFTEPHNIRLPSDMPGNHASGESEGGSNPHSTTGFYDPPTLHKPLIGQ